MTDTELPMLAGIGAFIRWCEELASLLAGPVLTLGLGIALVDLFTAGQLLATTPALLLIWAISQTVGLDAQLVGSAAKLGAAIRRRDGLPIIGYALLVCALGYVAFQASNVFATQQAEGITTAQALARLGMDSARWIIERSALAVLLVILSGLLRYIAPAKVKVALADERADLERQLELEPLRQRLRAQQVGGWRTVAETALRGVQGAGESQNAQTATDDPAPIEATTALPTTALEGASAAAATQADPSIVAPSPDRPPTGGGSPAAGGGSNPRRKSAAASAADAEDLEGSAKVTPLHRQGSGRRPKQDRKSASRANARSGGKGAAEVKIRAALRSNPAISFDELVAATGVSRSTASKHYALWLLEQRAAQ